MKKALIAVCSIIACTCANAQQTIYLCDGFESTPVKVNTTDNITFSADQSSIYLGSTEYDINDIDSITLAEPMFKKVTITYNGSSATVDIPSYVSGVTSTVSGANVTLTSTNTSDEILYCVSGASTNGSLTINGEYKLTLELAGLDLTSTSTKAPIDIECGKRIGIILKEGTTNTLVDASTNSCKGALYTEGHIEFEGAGTLNVTGNTKHAICAKEYLQFKKSTGTVNILGAVNDGIHCGKGKVNDDNSYFQINGGTINISNVGSDCIDCDDYGCAFIKGGSLTLNVSQSDGTGLKVDSCIYMTGGNINVNVTGNISDGIRASYATYFNGGTITETVSGNGSRGIRAKKTTKTTDTVLNGGYMEFNGTTADITVTGSTYTSDSTVCYGLKADTQFKQTAGTITITVNSSDSSTQAYKFKSNVSTGGTLTVQ
jgi:hypothetical protein